MEMLQVIIACHSTQLTTTADAQNLPENLGSSILLLQQAYSSHLHTVGERVTCWL